MEGIRTGKFGDLRQGGSAGSRIPLGLEHASTLQGQTGPAGAFRKALAEFLFQAKEGGGIGTTGGSDGGVVQGLLSKFRVGGGAVGRIPGSRGLGGFSLFHENFRLCGLSLIENRGVKFLVLEQGFQLLLGGGLLSLFDQGLGEE